MQTLHLRFRALRAISLGLRPDRWSSPSMQSASTWKGAPPLPNHPKPTSAVGSQSVAPCARSKGLPGLSNSPVPSYADGSRPASQHPVGILCPVAGAGLPRVPRLRAALKDSRVPVFPYRVCRWQTASELSPYPAPQEAGDLGTAHWQARASEVRCTPSPGLFFSNRPQLRGELADWKRTGVCWRCGSGAYASKATSWLPTGSSKFAIPPREGRQTSPASCADEPPLVTGQGTAGTSLLCFVSWQHVRLCSVGC